MRGRSCITKVRFGGGPGVGVGEGGLEVAEWKLEVSEKSESSGEAREGRRFLV